MSRPELLKHVLNRQIRRLGIDAELARGRVLRIWDEVVGPQIAAHATAVSLKSGLLTVAVPESTWRYELCLSKRELIERLNAAVERKVIRDIYFVAAPRKRDP